MQQLGRPHDIGLVVYGFRPLLGALNRVQRSEQLFSTVLAAMRMFIDPAETGAVTIRAAQRHAGPSDRSYDPQTRSFEHSDVAPVDPAMKAQLRR